MRTPLSWALALYGLWAACPSVSHGIDFFTIQSVKIVTEQRQSAEDTRSKPVKAQLIEVTVRTAEQIRSDALYAKVYFYTPARDLIGTADAPQAMSRDSKRRSAVPVFFEKLKAVSLYFEVPETVLATPKWQAVGVFGDKDGAAAVTYPRTAVTFFDFPERPQVDKPQLMDRKPAIDPVIKYVVKTRSPKQPQITLFLRPPVGMSDMSEANGVLAVCLLGNNEDEIRRRLLDLDTKDDVNSILHFAEEHQLVILCWGSRSLWNPRANWDEQSQRINREMDETFDDVAAAWEKGVEELSRKYGMPQKDFLLWGLSGSAQYACRLALRKPQYFLAVHLHVPSSFDKPTPEANRVLWCLTTGELEVGYERSLRFLSACRDLGYPIIYKAIVGLGHAEHTIARDLGARFFEYALSMRGEKADFESNLKPGSPTRTEWIKHPNRPWPYAFRSPPFVGDVVNQQVLPGEKADLIPPSYLISLPTSEIAETWRREK